MNPPRPPRPATSGAPRGSTWRRTCSPAWRWPHSCWPSMPRLLFTNRVMATGDILYYFYPYRDYVAEVLRSGRIPFWNPYLFLGAPLLANPQAAVLYPLHWPLIALPVTQQIAWSLAIHTWLLGYGGYWLLRRWGYGAGPGLVTGLVLAGSGFVGGLAGHVNQLNGAAWLPWALLVIEGARQRRRAVDLAVGAVLFAAIGDAHAAGGPHTVGLHQPGGRRAVGDLAAVDLGGAVGMGAGAPETAAADRVGMGGHLAWAGGLRARRRPGCPPGGAAAPAHAGVERPGPARRRPELRRGEQLQPEAAPPAAHPAAELRPGRPGGRVRHAGLHRVRRLCGAAGPGVGRRRRLEGAGAGADIRHSLRRRRAVPGVRPLEPGVLPPVFVRARFRPLPGAGALDGAVHAGRCGPGWGRGRRVPAVGGRAACRETGLHYGVGFRGSVAGCCGR